MIFLLFGRSVNLDRWSSREFSREVLLGAPATDDRDYYARIVGNEPPGEPVADGPFRRVASAILDYRGLPTLPTHPG